MIQIVVRLLSLIPTAFKQRFDLALENLALRQQLVHSPAVAPTAKARTVRSNLLAPSVPIVAELEGCACRCQT
jgi:hypothetical protein